MNKNESIINVASLLYRLLCKGDALVLNTLVLKHWQHEISNQNILLLSWYFFLEWGNGIKKGTEVYWKSGLAQIKLFLY